MHTKSLFFSLLTILAVFTACDEDTATLGSILTDEMDHIDVAADTFKVTSRSIAAGSVLARTTDSYLGTICDPETGDYLTCNFMTKFHVLEDYTLPELDSIASRDAQGEVVVDSIELRLFFNEFYGDSLTTMKLRASEMGQPMVENQNYYSDFNPQKEGLLRENGLTVTKSYTLSDQNVNRTQREDENYVKNIRILLNKPYYKDGKEYNNLGTYLMREYYKDPSIFKNSVRLAKVLPGFYIESIGGLGAMAYIHTTQLNFYFQFKNKGKIQTGTTQFAGTEEVLQKTTVINDSHINDLVADNSCTYIKTPAGIYTELTLPVDDIIRGHETDSINQAKVTLTRINNKVANEYSYKVPQTLLMIPADSLTTFFEKNSIINNITSFIAKYDATKNTYTFNNIGGMISYMKNHRGNAETWNRVLLVPVKVSYSTSEEITRITHDMSISSTRLVGGSDSDRDPISISIVYSKFKKD